MDLSALIFVALAVAWACFLIPKAIRHHDDVVKSRSVERFSQTMRVLARREPVDRRGSRLVVTPGRPASKPLVERKAVTSQAVAPVLETPEPVELTPAQRRARRLAARAAARRRRNVLGLLLLANVVIASVAAFGVISWWYAAIPGALLLAWLVTCRLTVRSEQRASAPTAAAPPVPRETPVDVPLIGPVETVTADLDEQDDLSDMTQEVAVVVTEPTTDPTLWDPVPVTLPTYVTKPTARRAVSTIDLDSTGVWTSGRNEADSALAREAEAADRADRAARKDGDEQRAVGS